MLVGRARGAALLTDVARARGWRSDAIYIEFRPACAATRRDALDSVSLLVSYTPLALYYCLTRARLFEGFRPHRES